MLFFTVEYIINDAADLLNESINSFKDACKSKTATQSLLMAVRNDKFCYYLSCTWYIKCRCSFCIA